MSDTPADGQDRKKKRGGPLTRRWTDRPTRWLPGVRGLTPSVLLHAATAWAASPAVGRTGAPASIPKRPGRAARFTGASAASQLGRGPASCTAHRGATSAWARHATGLACPGEVIHPDRRTPEALCMRRRPPRNSLRGPPRRAWQRLVRSRPFPCSAPLNLGTGQPHASADLSSAYATSCGLYVDRRSAVLLASWQPFHPMWSCAKAPTTCFHMAVGVLGGAAVSSGGWCLAWSGSV